MTKIPQDIASELLSSILTADGQEINNPTPLHHHTELNQPMTLDERVDRMLAIKLSKHNEKHGGETIEEATDFEVIDEFDIEPKGPFEFSEMQEEFLSQGEELDLPAPQPAQETTTTSPPVSPEIPPKRDQDAIQQPLPLTEPQANIQNPGPPSPGHRTQ